MRIATPLASVLLGSWKEADRYDVARRNVIEVDTLLAFRPARIRIGDDPFGAGQVGLVSVGRAPEDLARQRIIVVDQHVVAPPDQDGLRIPPSVMR